MIKICLIQERNRKCRKKCEKKVGKNEQSTVSEMINYWIKSIAYCASKGEDHRILRWLNKA